MPSSNKSARFPGLAFDRSGTRRTLRRVFANLLATTLSNSVKSPGDFAVSDEFLLKLLQSVDFVRIGTLTNAKTEYEQRMQPGAPSFEDLKSQGWIQMVREQIVLPIEYAIIAADYRPLIQSRLRPAPLLLFRLWRRGRRTVVLRSLVVRPLDERALPLQLNRQRGMS
jgi:hypothetical protein